MLLNPRISPTILLLILIIPNLNFILDNRNIKITVLIKFPLQILIEHGYQWLSLLIYFLFDSILGRTELNKQILSTLN